MKKMFLDWNWKLLILVFVSVFFRSFQLGKIPQAFHYDEAALGYNAWSLLETGKDEWGKTWPLTLQSFGDDKPAIYTYLAMPFVSVFGLNETTSRLPAIVSGSLLPLLLYLFIKKVTGKNNLAFWSGLITAISPWHIEVSRTAIEAGVAVFMLVFVMWALTKNKKWLDYMGLFVVLLSLFTYHTSRLVIPAVVLVAILLKIVKSTKFRLWGMVTLMILGISLSLTTSGSRFDQISIFNDQEAKLLREEAIREDGTVMSNIPVTRSFHNKYLSLIYSFADSLVKNTSLEFLFLGGGQPPRTTIPESGLFQLVLLPFFLFGLVALSRSWKSIDQFMVFWFLIAVLPVSLTYAEIPHTYRTLFMLPSLSYAIAKGIVFSWSIVNKYAKKLSIVFCLGFVLILGYNTFKTWHQYAIHQQVHRPWYRQFGYKDLISYINTNLSDASKITITNMEGEPYIFLLFYNQIKPSIYQASIDKRLTQEEIDNGKISWSFEKYKFVDEFCPYDPLDISVDSYYVVYKTCKSPCGYTRIHTINYMDGSEEFFIDRPMSATEYDAYLLTQNNLISQGKLLPKDIVDCRSDRR